MALLTSCFVQHRTVAPPGKVTNRPLLTASKDDLIERIHQAADPIRSFNMRADMSASVGKLYGGELTDYATVRTTVLFRRPDNIRVIGLDPVVHSSLIFDMVSTGRDFRVSVPSKNTFIEGDNDAPPNSANKLENLRPTAFLNSLIFVAPGPSDLTLLEDDTDETKAVYILFVVARAGNELRLLRAVYFDRYTLVIARQKTFGPSGAIVSETRYSDWKLYGNIFYPSVILIRRPLDGYEVTMTVIDMTINEPEVTPDRFVLEQPPGSQLKTLK
jgi:hypothetical protein